MRRLIPKIILTTGIVTTLVSGTIMVSNGAPYNNEINKLTDEQNKIYEEYMQSDEFIIISKQDLQEVTNAYADGKIDYETFKEKVQYLHSFENAKTVLASSDSKLKNDISSLDEQILEIKDKKANNNLLQASYYTTIGGAAVAGAGFLACLWPEKDEYENRFGYRV